MKITIIGAGPGGYETALEAAKKGIECVLISDGPVGGTCLNEGCIPTKSLCRDAELCRCRQGDPEYSKVLARKDSVVSRLREGVEFLLKNKLIRLIYGKASFADVHTVKVHAADGAELSVTSDYIIIATGSVPASLPVPGADLEGVIDSSAALSLQEIPRRLCIIGAGVIGLEFASVFSGFGSEVKVLEYCGNILPHFDTDMAKRLKQSLSRHGIKIETSARVQGIARDGQGSLHVSYVKGGEENETVGDKVLMAVGRRANVRSLNLDDIGLAWTERGITVNGYMQTSIPHIYAIGDVTGGLMLAHVATFQGYRALGHILAGQPAEGAVDNIDFSVVPAAVFTEPEAASVGLTEDECKERGIAYEARKAFFRANGKALSLDSADGYCKLLVDKETGLVLGCHIFGPHSSDLIHEAALLMNGKIPVDEYRGFIHAHPTLGEVLQAAARE